MLHFTLFFGSSFERIDLVNVSVVEDAARWL
jgi:hypothetical protein